MARKDLKKYLKKYWLFLLFIFVILLRLPALFEPFTYGDEGVYLALGQAARKGLVFYRDIHDNKPPMLYLLASLAGDFSTYRLIAFFWSLATVFVFYQLSKLLFKKNLLAIVASTTVFALLTNIHRFEGNVANAENFMLLPTIAAFYLVFKKGFGKKPQVLIWLLAGLFLGLATLFKVPAAFDFIAVGVLLFLAFFKEKKKNYTLFRVKRERRFSDKGRRFLYAIRYTLLLIGFILPILLTIIYYAFQGALNQYLTAAFFQNIPYLSSWSGQSQTGGLPLLLLARAWVVASLVLLLFLLRKKVSLRAQLILVWFGFSWFAALLSSRPYPHYLIQVLPALSLSFGLLFDKKKWLSQERVIPVTLLIVFLATFYTFQFWSYPSFPYYSNFYQFALRVKNQQEYFNDFDRRANTIYQLADYLQAHTAPYERIFIWGNIPFVYPLARRLPVGRYTVAYHIIDFNGYQETLTKLQESKPRYIIVDPQEKRPFSELFLWLEQRYFLAKQIGDFQIFHRLL